MCGALPRCVNKYRGRVVAIHDDRQISPEDVTPRSSSRKLFVQVSRQFEYREACHGAVCVEVHTAKGDFLCWHGCLGGDAHI